MIQFTEQEDIQHAREMMQNADRRQRELDSEVQQRVNAAMAAERKQFRNAELRYRYWLYITIGYGFLVTWFAGLYIHGFQIACFEFSRIITESLFPGMLLVLKLPARVAHFADLIPNAEWSIAVYWAVLLTICGASILGARWCAGRLYQFALFYKQHLADWISLEMALISVAAAVFFAESIQYLGINAIAAVLLINAGYTAVRSLIICRSRHMTRISAKCGSKSEPNAIVKPSQMR